MVHISKTTKVTTLVQENFFFLLKIPIQCDQNRVCILLLNLAEFGQTDQAMKSAAQGGPEDGHRKINFFQKLQNAIAFKWDPPRVIWMSVDKMRAFSKSDYSLFWHKTNVESPCILVVCDCVDFIFFKNCRDECTLKAPAPIIRYKRTLSTENTDFRTIFDNF